MDKGAEYYRRFLDGDEGAIGDIMDELFFKLVFFVDRFVHDVHTAEDIALDVMSDLFVHKHRYDFRSSLKTYLFMRGRSRAIDWIRHRKASAATELTEAAGVPDERTDLEEKLLSDERKRTVGAAVDKLPEDMRTAVHLVFFEEMSYAEAASVMKKNRKQIDNLLYRAKKELYAILGDEGRQLL